MGPLVNESWSQWEGIACGWLYSVASHLVSSLMIADGVSHAWIYLSSKIASDAFPKHPSYLIQEVQP